MRNTGLKKNNKNIFLIIFIAVCVMLCVAANKFSSKNKQTEDGSSQLNNTSLGIFPNTPLNFENAYIISTDNSIISFIYNGNTFNLPVAETYTVVSDNAGYVADIMSDNTGVYMIHKKTVTLTGKVINVTDESINIKDMGEVSRADRFAIYNVYGTPIEEQSANVLLGFEDIDFIIENDVLEAAVIKSGYSARNIRILLTDTEGSRYHHYVEFSCDTDYSVNYGDRIEMYTAADIITVDTSNTVSEQVITIAANSPDGKIIVSSINKSSGTPSYRGTVEIQNTKDGFLVINELSLEEYLYAVVSSEMPSSYNMEALKVQAICARGYAYSKMNSGAYSSYGAHLDDTTACQVYNNIFETENSINAVKATTGMVPSYNGEIIDAYYFSTSCGTTCTNSDVWNGNALGYLNDSMETYANEDADLSDEQNFRDFIDGKADGDCFERDLPFYRWSVTFTWQEMTDAVNSVIAAKMSSDLSCFMELAEDGTYKACTESYDTIGEVSDIKVTKRGNSGIITEIIIIGSLHTLKITGQSMMRGIMTPANVSINKQDGTQVTGWSMLPSPYYYVVNDSNNQTFTIYGGGFGHGVGMSQNGANIMAENGYSCEEIIKHYYHNVDIIQIYNE